MPSHENLREATLAEKEAFLSAVSRGYTRSMFHDVPLNELPLYHNGHDFYLMTGSQQQCLQLELGL